MLGADFLAASQLLIYVGGILVLLLFGVMLTHKLYDLDLKSEVTQFLPGAHRGRHPARDAGRHRLADATGRSAPGGPRPPPRARSASSSCRRWLLPFEAASILLLIALVGAAMIVRRRPAA